jgi:hypothetical protein
MTHLPLVGLKKQPEPATQSRNGPIHQLHLPVTSCLAQPILCVITTLE